MIVQDSKVPLISGVAYVEINGLASLNQDHGKYLYKLHNITNGFNSGVC